jgi:hypothetical protein
MRIRRNFIFSVAITLFMITALFGSEHETGDALQLLSYRVTPSNQPNVADGQIAGILDPTDWSAAYVRTMTMAVDGDVANGTRNLSFLVGNDGSYLYIGVAVELPNASVDNRLTLYFDQGTEGVLDGAPGAPGEYYVTAVADGSAPEDGHWNGSAWTQNTVHVASGVGIRKGATGDRLYNFEFRIPLSTPGDASNSYLNLTAGEEVGIQVMVTDNGNNQYFWIQTNASTDDPSATGANGKEGWGEIRTIGNGIADRNLVSLYAKDIIPSIDGQIGSDTNWRYAFQKDMVFSDFDGHTLNGSFRLKEQNDLYLGITLENHTPSASDYLAVYFDQGAGGGDLNYILTSGGDPRYDQASRVTGTGAYQDYYFDTNNWVADGSAHGAGGAAQVGNDWEVEMRVPMASVDNQDLNVATGDVLGMLLKYYDSASGRSYWWSATVNSEKLKIDPVDGDYNALGWGYLQTGGPFIQPIYPQQGDTLSGEFPLALYAMDPTDPVPETGIVSVDFEVRKEDQGTGSVITLLTGSLAKIEDDVLPLWTGTLNTRAISESPGTPLILVYIVDDGELDAVSIPIRIFVNNEGGVTLDDPKCWITSPSPRAVLSGSGVGLSFTASTRSPLTVDTIRVYIDGDLMETHTPSGVSSYSGTYWWNTTNVPDGEHSLQIGAVNSLGLENLSPTVLVTTLNTPSVTITSPSASARVRGTISVSFSANPVAPSQLTGAEISVDGGSWNPVDSAPPASGGAGNHNLDTTVLPDGSHTLQVRVMDNSGKTGYSGVRTVIVDNTPPAGVITADPALVKNGDSLVFSYYAFETSLTAVIPVAQIQILDDQAVSDLILNDPEADGIYMASYLISAGNNRPDGVKTLAAAVTDAAGNTYNPQVQVELDNTPPVLVDLQSADGDTIFTNGETIVLLAAFDGAGYTVTADFSAMDTSYVAGSEAVEDMGDGTYRIRYTISETNSRANGRYGVTVTARDSVGLTDSGTIYLTLDNAGPVVTGLALSDADNILNSDTQITAVVTDDDANIQGAEFFVDVIGEPGEGTALSASDGSFDSMSEEVTGTLSIGALAEGSHTLYVRGRDVSGEWGSVTSLGFVVDRVAPRIVSISVRYPAGQPAVRNGQSVAVSALIYEETTSLNTDHVLLFAPQVDSQSVGGYLMVDDGSGGDLMADDGVYTGVLVVTSGATGAFGFVIEAADIVPNTAQADGSVVLDNTSPDFVSVQSADGDTIFTNGETVVLLAAFDGAGYTVTADFSAMDTSYVAGSEAVEDMGDGTYRIRYTISETNSRANGRYGVTVTARDSVGLTDSGTIYLTLDNAGPVVMDLALSDADNILNSDTQITAVVTDDDANIQGAEFFVDVIGEPGEGTALSASDGSFDSMSEEVTGTLSIGALPDGHHILYIRGQDISGEWGRVFSLAFIVDRVPPSIEIVQVLYPGDQLAARIGQTVRVTALINDATTRLDSSRVFLFTPQVDSQSVGGYLMVDDGTGSDEVSGDGVFTGILTVRSDSTGAFSCTVTAADIVPNEGQIQTLLYLDNIEPQVAFNVLPIPEDGEVYVNEIVIKGSYFDLPDSSNISNIEIRVCNADGDHVNNSPVQVPVNEERRFSQNIRLVEGVNQIHVVVTDFTDNEGLAGQVLTFINPIQTNFIGTEGGIIQTPDGIVVDIPANALLSGHNISITTVSTSSLPDPMGAVRLLDIAHDFKPDGLVFHKPVTITLPYSDALLDVDQDGEPDFQEHLLEVFYLDGNTWIHTTVDQRDARNNRVTFTTNHFSVYALGNVQDAEEFKMYWTKNPFDPREGTSAVMELEVPGKITLKVYDLSGDLVRTIADKEYVTGSTERRWDGLNDFNNYVGSGLYIYIFEFEDESGTKNVIKKPIGVIK